MSYTLSTLISRFANDVRERTHRDDCAQPENILLTWPIVFSRCRDAARPAETSVALLFVHGRAFPYLAAQAPGSQPCAAEPPSAAGLPSTRAAARTSPSEQEGEAQGQEEGEKETQTGGRTCRAATAAAAADEGDGHW